MTEPVSAPPAYAVYKKRAEEAGLVFRAALNRNPNDSLAWDTHHREVEAAKKDLREADPETARRMFEAGMRFTARHGTPPAADNRTDEQKAWDALFGLAH